MYVGVGVVGGRGRAIHTYTCTHTIITNKNKIQAFKAEFDGSGTTFAPVVAPGEEPEEPEGGAAGQRRVLKYAEGLAHRLVVLDG